MKWFGKKGEEECFVRLIQLAREDQAALRQLLGLLGLPPFHRNSALTTFIEHMRLQGAPDEFIDALSILLDDEVAQKAYEVLSRKE